MPLNLQGGMCYVGFSRKVRTRGDKTVFVMDNNGVLTTHEAIKYLRISKATYLKYIRLGRIKAVKARRGWKVHRSELRRFL